MKHDEFSGPIGLAGRITGIFLRNREISVLTIIVLAVWGTVSFLFMPKQYNPEIVAPAFVITTDFPGASVEELYELVTRPMEDRLSELPDVDEISSRSMPGARSMVSVKFFVGSDRENAKIELNQKLRDGMPGKPSGASDPVVESIDPDDVPVLDIGLSSPSLSESSLRRLGHDISDALKLVEGVSRVEVRGGHRNDLWIEIDALALFSRGMTIGEVMAAVTEANGFGIRDTLSAPGRNPVVSISGDITGVDALSKVVIRQEGSAVVRIGDIASVSYGTGDLTSFVRSTEKGSDGKGVVHVAVSKLRGTNSTEVSHLVRAALSDLESRIVPEDVSVTILNDEGEIAGEEISKLTFDLGKSIAIVGALLLVFLGARNALVASISIPLVLLAVFGAGLLVGETVNRITLFALILSLGLLVDDAIVVVENIARYFRSYPGHNRVKLIVRAVDEVGGALSLSTLTMALAFFPMAFVTGMMGPYMGPIPFFVPAALFASLLFAVTINPFLALLLVPSPKPDADGKSHESGALFRVIKRVESSYAVFLSSLIFRSDQRRVFLGLTLVALIVSLILPLTPLVPFRMLPKADKDHFFVYLDMPDGTDVLETDRVSRELESLVFSRPEAIGIESFVGASPVVDFNGLFKGSSSRVAEHQTTMRVRLTHAAKRDVTSEEVASAFRRDLSGFTELHPDADIRIVEDPPGPPVLSTLYIEVEGPDNEVREAIARDMERMAKGTDGVVDISTSIPERSLGYSYRIDAEKAQRLGVDTSVVASTVRSALSGSAVGSYHGSVRDGLRKAEEERLMVRFAEIYRDEERDLSLIMIPGKSGSVVPLSEILVDDGASSESEIVSDDRDRVAYVSGEMEGRSVVYAAIDLLRGLSGYALPEGSGEIVSRSFLGAEYEDSRTHERYRVEISGEWKLTLEVFRDLGIAMGLAIFLIYFVLAAKSASLTIPLIIMVSIPLSLIGVMPGFAILQAIKGTYFNATSMIGVIALAGLAVKNAVIYLEYLEPLKKSGMPIEKALVEAGRVRLLPITLTSLAAILGSFTIVSDPVWEGLAWSIIFGLTASTFLTLLVFPLSYYLAERRLWKRSGSEHHE